MADRRQQLRIDPRQSRQRSGIKFIVFAAAFTDEPDTRGVGDNHLMA
jgi:hypothetical protein